MHIMKKRVKELYEKLKLFKSTKNKLELLQECKETLMMTISNPMMTVKDLEIIH